MKPVNYLTLLLCVITSLESLSVEDPNARTMYQLYITVNPSYHADLKDSDRFRMFSVKVYPAVRRKANEALRLKRMKTNGTMKNGANSISNAMDNDGNINSDMLDENGNPVQDLNGSKKSNRVQNRHINGFGNGGSDGQLNVMQDGLQTGNGFLQEQSDGANGRIQNNQVGVGSGHNSVLGNGAQMENGSLQGLLNGFVTGTGTSQINGLGAGTGASQMSTLGNGGGVVAKGNGGLTVGTTGLGNGVHSNGLISTQGAVVSNVDGTNSLSNTASITTGNNMQGQAMSAQTGGSLQNSQNVNANGLTSLPAEANEIPRSGSSSFTPGANQGAIQPGQAGNGVPSSTTRTAASSNSASSPPSQGGARFSYLSSIYSPSLAPSVGLLKDNAHNVQVVVKSASGGSSSQKRLLTGPAVVTGLMAPQGRRLLSPSNDTSSSFSIFFCDVFGNALWKWERDVSETDSLHSGKVSKNSKVDNSDDLCTGNVTVSVAAYQSGCSRQNHPEGCNDLYYKGCSGISVNPITNRPVIARTGGRTLGILSFEKVGGVCQGRIVDAITTYRGQKFNSPTGIGHTSNGILFFTDAPFGLAKSTDDLEGKTNHLDTSPLREIPYNGIYMLRNNDVELVDCLMSCPNKLAFSPKEDRMYVTNSEKGNSYIKVFDLSTDGSITDSKVFYNLTTHDIDASDGYVEGITVDSKGNVYAAYHKSLLIFSSNATLVGTISTSQRVNDLTIGEGQIIVTGEQGIYALAADVAPAVPIRATITGC